MRELHNYTVVSNFNDIEQIGRNNYMDIHTCCSASEVESIDFVSIGKKLLHEGNGKITPYSVVYDNGLPMQQVYNGKQFPAYDYFCGHILSVGIVNKGDNPTTEVKEWLYLPYSDITIAKAPLRIGADGYNDIDTIYNDSSVFARRIF